MTDVFHTPPPVKYDGVIREGSYLLRHLLAAWDIALGVNVKPKTSEEDRARYELGEIEVALSHTRNVVRALSARRDALADALVIVQRPRVEAAEQERT